jgi:hypothetical protein
LTTTGKFKHGQHPWFDELEALEMELLDPEARGDPERLDLLLGNDYVEFGSSGRVYHKKLLIDMLINEAHAKVVIRDFDIRELSLDVALVTYRSVGGGGRETRRSSVWIKRAGLPDCLSPGNAHSGQSRSLVGLTHNDRAH